MTTTVDTSGFGDQGHHRLAERVRGDPLVAGVLADAPPPPLDVDDRSNGWSSSLRLDSHRPDSIEAAESRWPRRDLRATRRPPPVRTISAAAAIRNGHDPGVVPKLPSATKETVPGTMPTAVPMA